MANIALIIAGGVGSRTGQDIPKQFIHVNNKPIIIYTLEVFQNDPMIDEINVVCLKGWDGMLQAYARQFNISKLHSVVPGGENGQGSIRNGIFEIAKRHNGADDIVLIHDAIRPLVDSEVLSDSIRVCREKGNSITVCPCDTAVLISQNSEYSEEQMNRDLLKMTQTPQTFFINDIEAAHKEALEKGITSSVASCTMYIELGRTLYLSKGSSRNIKITSAEDIEVFKALTKVHKEDWMK